jgi:hypothetical protein
LNEEGREFRWLPPAAAKRLPLNTPTKILLDAVMKNLEGRVPRVPKMKLKYSGTRVTRPSGRAGRK